jgi:hypothetical protein
MDRFVNRVLRAMKLDKKLYEEIEADTTALPQAVVVIVLSSIAAGLGSVTPSLSGLIVGTIAALISWLIWAYLIYFVGVKWLAEPQTKSNLKELLRVLGFASAPGLIRIIGIIPFLRAIIFAIAFIWMIAAMVVAVKQALDYTRILRAVAVCFIGWLAQIIVFLAILLLNYALTYKGPA